jgi:hypothetical protein
VKIVVLISILGMAISGCTTPILKTTNFPKSLSKATTWESLIHTPRIGMPYYLPTALVPITITLDTKSLSDTKSLPEGDINKNAADLWQELSKAANRAAKPAAPEKPTPGPRLGTSAPEKPTAGKSATGKTATEKPPLVLQIINPNQITIGKDGQVAIKTNTDGKADGSSNNDDKSGVKKDTPDVSKPELLSQKIGPYQVTIGAPTLIPDTSSGLLFLKYNPSFATEDSLTLGVGANQLLQSINAKSIDKSGEILVTLAKIGVDLAEAASGIPSTAFAQTIDLIIPPSPKPECTDPPPVNISTYLDPTSIKNDADNPSAFSIDSLNQLLEQTNVPIEFNVGAFDEVELFSADIYRREISLLGDRISFLQYNLDTANKNIKDPKIINDPTATQKYKKTIEDLEAAKTIAVEKQQYALDKLTSVLKTQSDLNAKAGENALSLEEDLNRIHKHATGVLFRVAEPYRLKISLDKTINKTDSDWCVTNKTVDMMVMAPSKRKTFSIDVNRGALITKTTNLTIVDGMLTKIEVNKPSSLLGIVNVPLEIIQAILSPVTNLFTVRMQDVTTPKPSTSK